MSSRIRHRQPIEIRKSTGQRPVENVDLDDQRARTVARTRERVDRRRDALRPTAERYDKQEFDSACVISLDPGGTTGWSLMEVHPEALSDLPEHRSVALLKNVLRWQHGQIDCGSVKGNLGEDPFSESLAAGGRTGRQRPRDVVGGVSTTGENAGIGEILGLIRAYPHAAVVMEDFILDPSRFNTGRDLLSPVRIISAVSFDLWLQGRSFYVQMPSLAKSTAGDEQLKAWGFYERLGGKNHARDADRHSLTFLKRASELSAKGRALRIGAWNELYGKGGEFYNSGVSAAIA